MANIHFFSEGISFKFPHPIKTAKWLKKVASKEGRNIESLTYILCSDDFLKSLNKQFLNHSTYTDILSFDTSEGDRIEGEIYISIPRVRENAKKFGQSFDQELRRVVVHGLLHFLGHQDKTIQQKTQMRIKEEACLSLWK
ncbi:MAG: rRNA maturation RNase YbeY [Cyclobacteriaceae bacterium]|nr:rRNA maturation RNase YbeY [Cyclobacteriaceae bacterium]